MDKKIAPGLCCFFLLSFCASESRLAFSEKAGVKLQLHRFHITKNYGCLHSHEEALFTPLLPFWLLPQ